MKIGVSIFLTDQAIEPVRLGEELEARGFESLWLPEHSHIPASRITPWGGRRNAPPLPSEYWRTLDSYVALGAIAAVTDRLVLGTGITLVAQRDPIWLAKEIATLDLISGGRFQFGIGFGWNREEIAQHGVEFSQRRALVAEQIGLMKALWTEDEASYSGELLILEPSWAWPKPVQKPHPPIHLGSIGGPKAFAAVADFCDGWIPIGTRNLEERIALLHKHLEMAGRDPASCEISLFGIAPDQFRPEWEALGVSRAILGLPPAPADVIVPLLDEYQGFLNR